MFKLPEVKTLRVVLRGIPHKVTTEEVEQKLMDMGFEVVAITRIILVQLTKPD